MSGIGHAAGSGTGFTPCGLPLETVTIRPGIDCPECLQALRTPENPAPMPGCDMGTICESPVTHIGAKGYVYCERHAIRRRVAGYENTRKMRAWELELIREGKPIPSYRYTGKPKPASTTHQNTAAPNTEEVAP